MKCLLCGKPTTGSVGAAGIKWPNVCQPCKDEEDAALLSRVRAMRRITDSVTSLTGCLTNLTKGDDT
jgi:hypothetical protein